MAGLNVGSLGEYIREQRRNAQYSLRQLADAAGVSNPYLSQIERGLRRPSAEILQQIAKALRISAETLYVQAGILEERPEGVREVQAAILSDTGINERQKRVLLEIYEAFRKENAGADADAGSAGAGSPVNGDTAEGSPAAPTPLRTRPDATLDSEKPDQPQK
ncbi:helix-turn-helix domain-containing protein [Yinghuangia sp. ASG 101]|uniref:helix-turn-helix domain-containing protein n=1 Tax=Yinghuangia sp. ASG 101 TaxID=2896848 RepID=UPI001E512023|nr:helix-turn-helix transcriptional regulator [Yinghuangia sp. ASG 101]UGQ14900.1 helix-turn-helix domain-containing protein [Yinghuangia sp. ASG 101]